MKTSKLIILSLNLLFTFEIGAQKSDDAIMKAIKTEVDRNFRDLKMPNAPSPFFIDFNKSNLKIYAVKAVLGNIVYSGIYPFSQGSSNVLIGDYNRNNLNVLIDYRDYRTNNSRTFITGDDEQALRIDIWQHLDGLYKKSLELYGNKLAMMNQLSIPEEELNIPDFEQRESGNISEQEKEYKLDKAKLDKYMEEASSIFRQYPDICDSYVGAYIFTSTVRYYNTEGTECKYQRNFVLIEANASGQSVNGQWITQNDFYQCRTVEQLPSVDDMKKFCRRQADLLTERLNAPIINESYSGPVMFEGNGIGALFNMLANDENGIIARRKLITSPLLQQYGYGKGNDLEEMMNKKVISRSLSVTSMSGCSEYKGTPLTGYYPVDAEGVVPDKELDIIKNGVLKTMLNGRIPTKTVSKSNGHSRQTLDGTYIFNRPGVLRLTSNQTSSPEEMKEKLIQAAKNEDYDYAYIIRGFDGNKATHLYRINVGDGTEEVVGGALIDGLTIRSMRRVLATSDEEFIYNICWNDIPSSYILPVSIILEEVDIIKDSQIQLQKPYIVPKPEIK